MMIVTPILLVSLLLLAAADGQDAASLSSQVLKLLSMPLLDGGQDADYTCPTASSPTKRLNDFHMRGTSLGGWLVLEPWITPSLFYQFLGPRLPPSLFALNTASLSPSLCRIIIIHVYRCL